MVFPDRDTLPTPWLIDTDAAFDTFQVRLVESPMVMMEGLVVNELITGNPEGVGGGAAPVTITSVVAVTLPEELKAVSV